MALLSMFFVGYIMLHCGASTDPETRDPTTVHRNRNLDHYAIGRPLERYAGFWLNYMKGLKGEREDSRRIPTVPRPSVGTHPYWAETPTRRDLVDPRLSGPLGAPTVAHNAEFDDLRDIIARANRRNRQREIDDQRMRLGLY